MFFKRIDTGMLQSNCYILGAGGGSGTAGENAGKAADDGIVREAAVIDPGADYKEVVDVIEANGLTLKYIILTHGHIDHILHMTELQDACGGEVVIHEKDAPLLKDSFFNGSVMFAEDRRFREADILVRDGDILELRATGGSNGSKSGDIKLEFIHTPGHTPGSMCIRATELLPGEEAYSCIFTGDTLFRLSIGRTDLGAGDSRQLAKSLQRLMELEDDLTVYPGHGQQSSIGYEKRHNRFIGFVI